MQIHQLPSTGAVTEGDKLPISQSNLTKYVTVQQIRAPRVSTVDDAATVSVNVTGLDRVIINPLGQNTTINLTGGTPGQTYTVVLTQDGTGSRTVTLGGSVVFATGDSYTATTTANKSDVLGFMVSPTGTLHWFLSAKKGL